VASTGTSQRAPRSTSNAFTPRFGGCEMRSRFCSKESTRQTKGPSTVNSSSPITIHRLATARRFFFSRSQASCQ